MGRVRDMWIGQYEDVADKFTYDLAHGFTEEEAKDVARASLRGLGLDPNEIDDYVGELAA